MFGRKKQKVMATVPPGVDSKEMKVEVPKAKVKVRKVPPREIIMGEIEQIAQGQELGYIGRSMYGDKVHFVGWNPQYPEKGKKYIMSAHDLKKGVLAGERQYIADSDKPKDIANWILSMCSLNDSSIMPEKWNG